MAQRKSIFDGLAPDVNPGFPENFNIEHVIETLDGLRRERDSILPFRITQMLQDIEAAQARLAELDGIIERWEANLEERLAARDMGLMSAGGPSDLASMIERLEHKAA